MLTSLWARNYSGSCSVAQAKGFDFFIHNRQNKIYISVAPISQSSKILKKETS